MTTMRSTSATTTDEEVSWRPSLREIGRELLCLAAIGVPAAGTNVLQWARLAVTLYYLGRLGNEALAATALALAFANLTAYSVLAGLSLGLEPLSSQAHGAGRPDLLSLSLHRAVALLLVTSIPIAALWLFFPSIVSFLFPTLSPTLLSLAYSFLFFSLPDLLVLSFLHPLRVFLRSQSVTLPATFASLIATLLNLLLARLLHGPFGVQGVAVASSTSNLASLLFLAAYVAYSSGLRRPSWPRRLLFSLRGWWPIICLSLCTAISVCLEWWFYELATFLSARLVDPKPKMAAMNVLMQAVGFLYTFPAAFGSAAATRVGNELGAGRPRRALLAAGTAIAGSIAMAATSFTLATKLARRWAEIFAPNAAEVTALVAAAMPIVGLCELGNCAQMVGSGVLRGCARPSYGAVINITAFYMVGAPVAVGLALFTGAGFIGIWLGLLAAQVCCAAVMMYAVWTIRWNEEARRARELVHGRNDSAGDVEFIEYLLTGDATPSRHGLPEFNRPESTVEEDSGDGAVTDEAEPLIVDVHDRASSP